LQLVFRNKENTGLTCKVAEVASTGAPCTWSPLRDELSAPPLGEDLYCLTVGPSKCAGSGDLWLLGLSSCENLLTRTSSRGTRLSWDTLEFPAPFIHLFASYL
jgi:hypothetical protein